MPDDHRRYVQPPRIDRASVEELLRHGGPLGAVETALVGFALNEMDLVSAYSLVLDACSSTDDGIRGTAVLCLGHLARIHQRFPDRRAVEVVRTALADSDDYVRGQAHGAASDIARFLPDGKGLF